VVTIVKESELTARVDMKSKAAPPYPGPDCQAGLAEKLLFLFVGVHRFRVTIFSSTLTFEPVIGYFSSKKIQSHLQLQDTRISKWSII